MALLALARGGELRDGHVARIQGYGQATDRAALAGRVPALEDDRQRRSQAVPDLPAGLQAERQQPALSSLESLAPLLARELQCQINRIEPAHIGILA